MRETYGETPVPLEHAPHKGPVTHLCTIFGTLEEARAVAAAIHQRHGRTQVVLSPASGESEWPLLEWIQPAEYMMGSGAERAVHETCRGLGIPLVLPPAGKS